MNIVGGNGFCRGNVCRETVLSLRYPLTFITINLILIDISIIDEYMLVFMFLEAEL